MAPQNQLCAALELCFWLHWKRRKGDQWIEIGLLGQLLQAQPNHPIEKGLQLLRQLGRSELEVPMWHHHDHSEMLHLWVQLQKARGLSKQPMFEPRFGVHLHLQQQHRPFRRARFCRARPEGSIEAVVRRFQFGSIKAIQRITRRVGPELGQYGGIGSTRRRQQQRDQIWRALKQAIEPVVRFQTPPPDNTRPTASPPGK